MMFVSSYYKSAIITSSFLCALLSFTSFSHAWETQAGECGGEINEGVQSQKRLYASTTTFPEGSDARQYLKNAIEELNSAPNTVDRFKLIFTSLGGSIDYGNGISEIAAVPKSSLKNPSSNARILYRYDDCHTFLGTDISDGNITEFDIRINANKVINGDLSIDERRCEENGNHHLQGTILHELMHALGAGHESDPLSVMNEGHGYGEGYGRYCSHHVNEIHPDDHLFLREYHGFFLADSLQPNVALSNHESVGPDSTDLVDDDAQNSLPGIYQNSVCPGDTEKFEFTFGNKSTLIDVDYNWVVHLSEDVYFDDGDDIPISEGRLYVPADTPYVGIASFNFEVPDNVEYGKEYRLIAHAFPSDSSVSDGGPFDDYVRLSQRIDVKSYSNCN